MISCKHVQPAFEILNFVDFKFQYQLLKNLHHGIFTLLFILQVIETYTEYQVHIFVIKSPQYLKTATGFVAGYKGGIILLLDTGIILYKFQRGQLNNPQFLWAINLQSFIKYKNIFR